MAIYMKHDTIQGNVTASPYVGWIEIQSLNFKVSRKIPSVVGESPVRNSFPQFEEICLHKPFDKATPELFKAVCCQDTIGDLLIDVCKTGSELTPYLRYVLKKVVISKMEHLISNQDFPLEEISLNYLEIEVSYLGGSIENVAPRRSGYDLVKAMPT